METIQHVCNTTIEEDKSKLTSDFLLKLVSRGKSLGEYEGLGGRLFAYSVKENGKVGNLYVSDSVIEVGPCFKK